MANQNGNDDYHTNLGQTIAQYAENRRKIKAIREKLTELGADCEEFDDDRFGSTDQKLVKDYLLAYHDLASSNVVLKSALIDMDVDIDQLCRFG